MRNLDDTYYLDDAIVIRHEVDYRFKNDRIGTIEAITTKAFTISKEIEFDCKETVSCHFTLEYPTITTCSDSYDYGYGVTLYRATSGADYGNQIFDYQTKLYNIGKEFTGNTAINSASVLVVKYEPKYQVYPYLILKDKDPWSYGKRLAIATHYLGSEGGEKDDSPGLHEQRRSKINGFVYDSIAFDKTETKLNIKDKAGLLWQESESLDEKVLESTLAGKHAVFIKAGYGKLIFEYPVKEYIERVRLENVTIDSIFQSKLFAGKDNTDLFLTNYTYPAVKFGNVVTVKSVNNEGGINPIPLSIKMVSNTNSGAVYLQDYLRDKIIRDTSDKRFSEIVLDDMYDKTNELSDESGKLELNANMTSLLIPELSTTVWSDRMEIPLHYALAGQTPYIITIEANGMTKTINANLYTHYSDQEFIINMDSDNVLNAVRNGKVVDIRPDENFGIISKLVINGVDYERGCSAGCIVNGVSEMSIEAYNEWGGKTSTTVTVAESSDFETEKPPAVSGDYDLLLIGIVAFIAVIAVGYVIQRQLQKAGEVLD